MTARSAGLEARRPYALTVDLRIDRVVVHGDTQTFRIEELEREITAELSAGLMQPSTEQGEIGRPSGRHASSAEIRPTGRGANGLALLVAPTLLSATGLPIVPTGGSRP